MLEGARACALWFDKDRQKPCILVESVPMTLPQPCKDGECSLSVHQSTREAVASFKQCTVEALAPSTSISSRRMKHYLDLLARQAGSGTTQADAAPLLQAKEAGALALAWTLAEIPEASQRPSLSHLEHVFQRWISEQVADASGTVIVRERQARIDVERIAGEEVPLRAIRKLGEWYGFRRIHAPRARLLIRP
jgi:hypothetical protein